MTNSASENIRKAFEAWDAFKADASAHKGVKSMTKDTVRRTFESWHVFNNGPSDALKREKDGDYAFCTTQLQWLAWQAAIGYGYVRAHEDVIK